MFRLPRPLACVAVVLASAQFATAAPSIQNVSPRGLQIGQPTLLTITGGDLGEGSQVTLDAPLAAQVVKQAAGNQLQVEVTVANEASAGIYALRVTNDRGISNVLAIGVDSLPQRMFGEEIGERPAAFSGNLAGAQILRTKLTGKAGERLVIDLESRRLGAQLRPVIRLYDARGAQVAWSGRRRELQDDARVETVLPTDGNYTIELHDVVYRGANPGFFRLKVGDLQTADYAFPLGVTRGEQAKVAVDVVASAATDSATTPMASVDVTASAATLSPVALPNGGATWTGGRPRVVVSDHAELVEQTPSEGAQTLSPAPVAVSGRLSSAGEEDRYTLPVTPGAKLRIEVLADRVGSALDGVLMVRNEKGGQLARGDDQNGTADPMVEYTIPDKVEHVVLAVKDLINRGGDDFYYRLEVTDISHGDYGLTMDADRVNVATSGRQLLNLNIDRRGYEGPVELTFPGLPSDVQVAGNAISAGQTKALVTLSATGPAHSGVTHVVGMATVGEGDSSRGLRRNALAADQAAYSAQPWLRSELAVGVAASPATLTVNWSNAADTDSLPLGGKLPVKLELVRGEQVTGKIRLRLLTTQIPPKKKEKKDNKEVEVDDVERTLRLESEPVLAADATNADLNLIVPADLPDGPWGVVLVAELLSADEKNVVQSAYTAARRLATSK
ncbi:MAG: hypothetical protein R3C99_04915 [Pirellulaceae bacterium]